MSLLNKFLDKTLRKKSAPGHGMDVDHVGVSVDANDFGMDQQHQPQYEVRTSAGGSTNNSNNSTGGAGQGSAAATPMNAGMNFTTGNNHVMQTSGFNPVQPSQQQSQGMFMLLFSTSRLVSEKRRGKRVEHIFLFFSCCFCWS